MGLTKKGSLQFYAPITPPRESIYMNLEEDRDDGTRCIDCQFVPLQLICRKVFVKVKSVKLARLLMNHFIELTNRTRSKSTILLPWVRYGTQKTQSQSHQVHLENGGRAPRI